MHLHLQPRACPLPPLGDSRRLDLPPSNISMTPPHPFKLCDDYCTWTQPPPISSSQIASNSVTYPEHSSSIKKSWFTCCLMLRRILLHFYVLDRTCNYHLFYGAFIDWLWAYCIVCDVLNRTGFIVYHCIIYNWIQATSWLHTWQFMQMNMWSYILSNLCRPLQMFAGIVEFTFMVVAYSLEVLCICIYLYTWISKFTRNLLLYMVMYLDIFHVHFCWWKLSQSWIYI